MANHKKYVSKLLAAVHETAEGLFQTGAIDKQVMREFDEACLTPTSLKLLSLVEKNGLAAIT